MDKAGLRIGVLMGGPSAERDVSLRSGKAIAEALLSKGYNAVPMEIWLPTRDELKSADIDVAFIANHRIAVRRLESFGRCERPRLFLGT